MPDTPPHVLEMPSRALQVAHTLCGTHQVAHTLCGTHALRQCVGCRGSVHTLSSRQVHGHSRSISLSAQHAHSACVPTASNHGVEHGNPLTGVDRSFSVAFEQRRNRGRRGGNAMLLANGTRDSQLVLRGWRTGPATPALGRRCQRTRPRRPNRVLRRRKGPIGEKEGGHLISCSSRVSGGCHSTAPRRGAARRRHLVVG